MARTFRLNEKTGRIEHMDTKGSKVAIDFEEEKRILDAQIDPGLKKLDNIDKGQDKLLDKIFNKKKNKKGQA